MAKETEAQIDAFMTIAARESGRPMAELRQEFADLKAGPGRLTADEYVKFALYDSTRYSPADKQAFLSDLLHWPIVRACCDSNWTAATEDKWLASRILDMVGLPTPRIIAVCDDSQRLYPGTRTIRTEQQFLQFLAERPGEPFFAKPMVSYASKGILRCEGHGGGMMTFTHIGELPAAEAYRKHLGRQPYILQTIQKNHSFFSGLCRNLATVRTGAVVYDNEVRLAFSFLKMPGLETIEDRFQVPGNIACELNPVTGDILSIACRTAHGYTRHTLHPEHGVPMIGLRLPYWQEVLDAVGTTARLFAPLRYQTMDIAITDAGPVVIEVNIGGGFAGPQMALGRGIMNTPLGNFLNACGINTAKFRFGN
jgi:hypothetical protein